VTLTYLSLTTAAFYHTPSETLAGYALVAALWGWFLLVHSGSYAVGSPSERRPLSLTPTGSVAARGKEAGVSPCRAPGRAMLAFLLWSASTAASWLASVPAEVGMLAGFLGYDAVLWLLLIWLSTGAAATPAVRLPGATREQATLTAGPHGGAFGEGDATLSACAAAVAGSLRARTALLPSNDARVCA
jgi:hypothetical protein